MLKNTWTIDSNQRAVLIELEELTQYASQKLSRVLASLQLTPVGSLACSTENTKAPIQPPAARRSCLWATKPAQPAELLDDKLRYRVANNGRVNRAILEAVTYLVEDNAPAAAKQYMQLKNKRKAFKGQAPNTPEI